MSGYNKHFLLLYSTFNVCVHVCVYVCVFYSVVIAGVNWVAANKKPKSVCK